MENDVTKVWKQANAKMYIRTEEHVDDYFTLRFCVEHGTNYFIFNGKGSTFKFVFLLLKSLKDMCKYRLGYYTLFEGEAWLAWNTVSLHVHLIFDYHLLIIIRTRLARPWYLSGGDKISNLRFSYLVQLISTSSSNFFHCYTIDWNMLKYGLNENEIEIFYANQHSLEH